MCLESSGEPDAGNLHVRFGLVRVQFPGLHTLPVPRRVARVRLDFGRLAQDPFPPLPPDRSKAGHGENPSTVPRGSACRARSYRSVASCCGMGTFQGQTCSGERLAAISSSCSIAGPGYPCRDIAAQARQSAMDRAGTGLGLH